jgi:maltooligosyltrehalose trehalohydrolase
MMPREERTMPQTEGSSGIRVKPRTPEDRNRAQDSPSRQSRQARRLPIGAEVLDRGVHFRVWAPAQSKVEVVLEAGDAFPLNAENDGYFSASISAATTGTRYRIRFDGSPDLYPDPASRFQPEGPHGPSQVVDPSDFGWTDEAWRGCSAEGQVVYEMHVGTFTPEGTWAAAIDKLAGLAELGVTILEVMPVADFPGRFGWGYDGVNMFAPTRLYGEPDDFRRFVDRAHALGIGVILDVVYNHVGPDGNHLKAFAPAYFTDRYKNEWGEALNFDGADAGPVREFFLANAGYWIDEFHMDGLRLDATQQIFDASPTHILTEIGQHCRSVAGSRRVYFVAENEPQQVKLVKPTDQGGYGLDALWNDDFHHSALVALTGRNEAYYTDYLGTAQEFVSAAKWGYLYQGQRYTWQKKRRGTPSFGLPPSAFVNFIENHDQVANTARGLRVHRVTTPGKLRAMTAFMILMPGTPMLFQGQEFGSSSPFFYFADHNPELAKLVRQGRAEFLSQFPSIAQPEVQAGLPDPADSRTFERSKLSWDQADEELLALHRDLFKLRREEPAFAVRRKGQMDGAVLGEHAFVLRYFEETGGDRLLLVNLGRDLNLTPAPEPLLAPPEGQRWEMLWSSEDPRYGGGGMPPPEAEAGWRIMGNAAVVLRPLVEVVKRSESTEHAVL